MKFILHDRVKECVNIGQEQCFIRSGFLQSAQLNTFYIQDAISTFMRLISTVQSTNTTLRNTLAADKNGVKFYRVDFGDRCSAKTMQGVK